MVQSIQPPTPAPYAAPSKPQQQAPALNVATAVPVTPPAQAPKGGRPVQAAPPVVDAEPQQAPEQRPADSTRLSIGHDDASDRYVYRGMDGATKEVTRQWPSEETLKRIARLREMSGKIFDEIL